jgi:hypothetical protein
MEKAFKLYTVEMTLAGRVEVIVGYQRLAGAARLRCCEYAKMGQKVRMKSVPLQELIDWEENQKNQMRW